MKRGYNGPFIFPKYFAEEETTSHIFIKCPFAYEVWYYTLQGLNFHPFHPIFTLEDVIFKWSLIGKEPIAIFLACYIWRNSNSLIFEGKVLTSFHLSYKIVGYFLEYADYKAKK